MTTRRSTLPFDRWPASDRAAWDALFAERGLFEEGGPAAHLRPATRQIIQKSYGHWLGWLESRELLDAAEIPADRITRERVRAFIASMEDRLSLGTVTITIEHLYQVARWLARGDDWHWLGSWKCMLRRRYRPTNKRDRLVSARALLDLGMSLMDEMRAAQQDYPVKWRTRYRDGLMIALLVTCPFRLGNFTAIRVGMHLQKTVAGYRIAFSADETKGLRPEAKAIPDTLVPYLTFYLEVVRPALLKGRDLAHFWVTKDGAPTPPWSVAKQVKHWTGKRLGRAINPYLFRHCAATDAARLCGTNHHLARDLLGHASLQTTERLHRPGLDPRCPALSGSARDLWTRAGPTRTLTGRSGE